MDFEDVNNIYGEGQYIEWNKNKWDPKLMN